MLMKNIIIVCAGSYGKEVYYTIRKINEAAKKNDEEEPFHILGFINDLPDALEGFEIELPVLGSIKDWQPMGDEVYALGLGTPASKEKVVSMLKERGCKFESIIAPYVIMPEDVRVGEGCLIKAYHIASGVKIGDFVNIHGSMLMPGAVVGNFSTLTGFAVVENAVVGEQVYIGSHAVITEGIVIGNNVTVAAGSIVTEDVLSDTKVFGYPAVRAK